MGKLDEQGLATLVEEINKSVNTKINAIEVVSTAEDVRTKDGSNVQVAIDGIKEDAVDITDEAIVEMFQHQGDESDPLDYYTKTETYNKEEIDNKFKTIDFTEVNGKIEANTQEIASVKQSVVDLKTKVASAVSDKGVPTLATDSGDTIANNIRDIRGFTEGWNSEATGEVWGRDINVGDAIVHQHLGDPTSGVHVPLETPLPNTRFFDRNGRMTDLAIAHTSDGTYVAMTCDATSGYDVCMFKKINDRYINIGFTAQQSGTCFCCAFSSDGEMFAHAMRENVMFYKRVGDDFKYWGSIALGSGLTGLKMVFSPIAKECYVIYTEGYVAKIDCSGSSPSSVRSSNKMYVQSNSYFYISPDGRFLWTPVNNADKYHCMGTGRGSSWDVKQTSIIQGVDSSTGIRAMSFSKDGNTLALAVNTGVQIHTWDSSQQKYIFKKSISETSAYQVMFSDDMTKLWVMSYSFLRVYDIQQDYKFLSIIEIPHIGSFPNYSVLTMDEDRLLYTQFAGTSKLYPFACMEWDSENNSILERYLIDFKDGQYPSKAVSFSPDGQYLYIGGNSGYVGAGNLFRYDRKSDNYGWYYSLASDLTYSVGKCAFSPNGKYLVVGTGASDSNHVVIWKINPNGTFTKLPPLSSYTAGTVTGLAFSPDSQYLIVGTNDSSNYLKLYQINYDTDTISQKIWSAGQPTNISGVSWSPDGKWIVILKTGGSTGVYVYEFANGVIKDKTNFALENPRNVVFSPNSKYCIIAGSLSNTWVCKITGDSWSHLPSDKFPYWQLTVYGAYFNNTTDCLYVGTNAGNFLYHIKIDQNTDNFTALPEEQFAIPMAMKSTVTGLVFSPDETKVVASTENVNDPFKLGKMQGKQVVINYDVPSFPYYIGRERKIGIATESKRVGEQVSVNVFEKLNLR